MIIMVSHIVTRVRDIYIIMP